MAVDNRHPDYEASAAEWARARDVLAGEDEVKAAGEKYLPRLDSQSDEEYAAYKARASFFGATARTLEEYLDLVFRRAPVTKAGELLRLFLRDCDRWGTEFGQYARGVVTEVLSVGRAGSLVMQGPNSSRPCLSFWQAEDILDWSTDWVGQRSQLTRLLLKDGARLHELRLIDSQCVEEVSVQIDGEWSVQARTVVARDKVPLSFIPFVFHGPKGSLPERGKLPLADIIAANLDHYRLDADYKHGLHFTALPTAWVSGFDKATALRIGSSAAWVSEVPGASAGFLEFSGAGLAHLERAIEKVEHRMALFGAHMTTSVVATGLTAQASDDQDLCGLGAIVESLNASLSRVLQLAQWWIQGGEPESMDSRFAMNTDLGACAMSGEEITAVVAAWRSGAISRDTMLERLKRGEVLPDGRTIAEERALIHGKGALR